MRALQRRELTGRSAPYEPARRFATHDNHERPYEVEVAGPRVTVRRSDGHAPPLWDGRAFRVFVDERPFGDNTVLFELGDGTCMFVGGCVSHFRPLAPICEYASPLGNNDVPYPYAVDADGRYYLLIEDARLDVVPEEFRFRPYTWYYKRNLLTVDRGWVPPRSPLVDTESVRKFFIAGERYTLRYAPRPREEYERLTRDLGAPLELEYANGERAELDADAYARLMHAFGQRAGFDTMHTTTVHTHRGEH